MTFLEQIFASLERSGDAVVLQELRDGQAVSLTARQLLGSGAGGAGLFAAAAAEKGRPVRVAGA